MKFSKKGYLRNSPDVNKPQNIIQGGNITMKGVDFKVHGVDNNGYAKVMTPGYDYNFPNAKYVTETLIKNKEMNGPFKMKPGRGNMPKTGKGLPKDMTNPIMQVDPRSGRRKTYSVFEDIPASAYQESEATTAYDNLAKRSDYDLGKVYKNEPRARREGYYRQQTPGAVDIYPNEPNSVGGKYTGFSSKATTIDPLSGKDIISQSMKMPSKDAKEYLDTQAKYSREGRKGAPKLKTQPISSTVDISTTAFDGVEKNKKKTEKPSIDTRKSTTNRFQGGYRGKQTVAGKAVSAVSDLFTKY